MQLKVITKDGITSLKDLQIGTNVLCEDGNAYPVKNIAVLAHNGYYVKLSSAFTFHVHPRIKIKTQNGFKFPEVYDILPISKDFTPSVIQVSDSSDVKFYYDIFIDGNMISPEGIVFKFSD
jgi:hypothetical protein